MRATPIDTRARGWAGTKAAWRSRMQPATIGEPGCNPTCPGLQPYVSRAATLCAPGTKAAWRGRPSVTCARRRAATGPSPHPSPSPSPNLSPHSQPSPLP
eukprot:scaffold66071_cov34-Phaeocystis_antarctica.AAC.1